MQNIEQILRINKLISI